MLQKITLITLLVLFSGVLVVGAANRTITKNEKVRETEETVAQGNIEHQYQNEQEPLGQQNGQGQGSPIKDDERQFRNAQEPLGQNQLGAQVPQRNGTQENDQGGQGQGGRTQQAGNGLGNQGRGNGGNSENAAPNQQQENLQAREVETHEWLTVTGTVQQAPAAGVDMILNTADGEMLVGTGPDYLGEQGYIIEIGDELEVSGFWEDDEFKVVSITNLADDSTIALRDEWGRPYWSGAARGGGYGRQKENS